MPHIGKKNRIGALKGAALPALIAEATVRLDPTLGVETGTGGVTAWRNQGTGGATWDLAQSISGQRPAADATGGRSGGPAIRFTAANFDRLETGVVSLSQPSTLVVIARTDGALVSGATISDARTGNQRRLWTGSADIRIYAGATLATSGFSADTYYKLGGVFNGASSKMRRDAVTTDGNAGANADSGLVLGTFGMVDANAFNGWVEWTLLWSRNLSDDELTEVFDWLG